MSRLRTLTTTARGSARELGIRAGLFDYRPLRWSPERWERSYRAHDTDGYGAVEELARYGVLLAYLGWLGPGLRVLDVGCGAGLLRARMESVPFAAYVGVDTTAAAIAQAAARADDRTSFVHGDPMVEDLGEHDVVVCNEVLYFAADPERLVERVGRFLRPGGHLLTSIWRHPGDSVLWGWIDERYERIDRVAVHNERNRLAPRGWQVACHRRRA